MEPARLRAPPPAADALTSLPAHLLDDILTRLCLRDAVRTSALARAWRHRWESLPALPLSFLDRPRTDPAVVDSILIRHTGRISRFSFDFGLHQRAYRLGDWLIALSRRGVESIHLRCGFHFKLHSSIFSCGQLVYLELHQCSIRPLPAGFAGFPLLEELNLTDVQFPENGGSQMDAIIRGSPLLGVLKLSHVVMCGEWVIQAPNLRSLTIISNACYRLKIGALPCLSDATIKMEYYVREHDFVNLVAGVAHVRELTLAVCYDLYTDGNLLETLPCTFDNLRIFILLTHFGEMDAILATFSLLRNAPNLEELEIEILGYGDQEIEANTEYQNTQWTDGMCAGLQVVKMNGIGCLSNEMCFIELVLSKATVLRTMSISLGVRRSKSKKRALVELLNTYRRASPHAQVIFKGSAGGY